MKKLASLLLTAILLFGCCGSVFADAASIHTITIENEKKGHIYQAYQIFKGDLDQTKTILSNIEWGDQVYGDSLLNALLEKEDFASCENAKDVARVLEGYVSEDDSAKLEAFAETAELYLSEESAGVSVEGDGLYTITVTGDGYYLVKDTEEAGDGDAYTKYILQVMNDVTLDVKADAPFLEKQIVTDTGLAEADSASVGDTVEYCISSKVPKMDGYEKYFFIVHDTLDEGLTFEKESVSITVGVQTLTSADYEVVTEGLDDGCTFEIIFKDFIGYKAEAGAVITIKYNAVVNQNAGIGNAGNANRAHLQYSNNPNVDQIGEEGNPDKPDGGTVTGVTPDDITITYLTGIDLFKIDDSEDQIRLQGAEFKLTGERVNQVYVEKGTFVEKESGSYFKLKNGSYTDIRPSDETKDRYESVEQKYEYIDNKGWTTVTDEVEASGMVDLNGEIHFHGLAAGIYEIEEITAPNGYNLLEHPITVEIKLGRPEEIKDGMEEAVWTYDTDFDSDGIFDEKNISAETGYVKLNVVNEKGALLPSTGGAGVWIFYILGIGLVAMAVLADSRKNRMNEG